jgi:D-hexose-6-phosphate mutarotase
MGDFNNDGYHDMICCEPGLLSNIPKLEGGGKECVFTQIMTTI